MRSRLVLFSLALALVSAGALIADGLVSSDSRGHAAPASRIERSPSPPSGAGDQDGDLGSRDVSVHSDEPAVTRLRPELLEALRRAARSARQDDDIELRVNSGWRSEAYQQRLLDDAVDKYGSREEALRWVALPETSAHVTGDAVDILPTDAAYWLSQHGAEFGLCQTYANEIWHYELLIDPGGTCPTPRADGAA